MMHGQKNIKQYIMDNTIRTATNLDSVSGINLRWFLATGKSLKNY